MSVARLEVTIPRFPFGLRVLEYKDILKHSYARQSNKLNKYKQIRNPLGCSVGFTGQMMPRLRTNTTDATPSELFWKLLFRPIKGLES